MPARKKVLFRIPKRTFSQISIIPKVFLFQDTTERIRKHCEICNAWKLCQIIALDAKAKRSAEPWTTGCSSGKTRSNKQQRFAANFCEWLNGFVAFSGVCHPKHDFADKNC